MPEICSRPRNCRTFLCLILWLFQTSIPAHGGDNPAPRPPEAPTRVDFAEQIVPLFARSCYSCHSADKQESNFRLDLKASVLAGGDFGEGAIVPGESEKSPLIRYISGTDDIVMPPKGARLSGEEVALIRKWIDQGAEWPDNAQAALKLTTKHWSFQPLQPVTVPIVPGLAATENPIDAFIAAKLSAVGLSLSPEADRLTQIRRLYLDMLGLPPTWEEINAFLHDSSDQAYAIQVERVLASPRYGERWARHWLDVVRFAETNGFETNVERPNAWRYRDYVIEALNSDKPYDQFVLEQLAGDALGADSATGFLVGGPWDQVKSPDPVLTAMQRSDELADITNTTGTAFLGLTVGCARCHNHKFDPILQKDYYALQAVFAGVQHGDRAIAISSSPDQKQAIERLTQQLARAQGELEGLRGTSPRGRTIVIDDEALAADGKAGVTLLAEKTGHGTNPDGTQRGAKSDPGDFDRYPNVSRGRYTWWTNEPGSDVLAYQPQLSGKYRIWLSWGCGHATHTPAAVYVLDIDGDRKTKDDQQVIATIDQRNFANSNDGNVGQALWSGFTLGGTYALKPTSIVLLRGGDGGTAITADAVAFEEVVEGTTPAEQPIQPPLRLAVNSRENIEHFPPIAARYIRFTTLATNSGAEPCIDELEVYSTTTKDAAARNVALATQGTKLSSSGDFPGNPIHRLQHINDGRYGNSFSWISSTANTGWVQIEFPETVTIDRVVWGRDRDEQYRDRTATKYVIEAATEPGKWQIIANSLDRLPGEVSVESAAKLTFFGLPAAQAERGKRLLAETQSLQQQLKQLTTSAMAYAGTFNTPRPTHRLYRGDPMQPREVVAPDCLTVLGTLSLSTDAPEQQRRVALAKWIADPKNPLTARVMVNRVWQHHFGTGIVDTPSDLGVNGAKPSHPELLDWLASEFMRERWSLKQLHRLILMSKTYRQSNKPLEAALKADAQCRLLWRYPPHRLEAETIRDAILATSGTLDLSMGGPGWSTFKPNSNYVRFYEPKEEFGPADWRRAIYMTKVRMRQDGVFGTFDCPDAGQIAPKRPRSTTALQALSLFNSQFVLDQAEQFSKRIEKEGITLPLEQSRRAFELTLGRAPDSTELTMAERLVKQHGLPALCRVLFNSNEFLFLP